MILHSVHGSSHEFFYRPCNFYLNILSSFEIIAKTLSVALEVSLSILDKITYQHFHKTIVLIVIKLLKYFYKLKIS